MKKKVTTSLCLIVASIMLMTIPTFPVNATPEPTVSVKPALNMFSTETTSVGDNFTVNVTAKDFVEPGLYAYQFQLHYNNTLLKGLSVELPEGHFLTPELDPGNLFITTLSVEQEAGYIDVAITLLGDEPGKTGSGVLVTTTFEITKAPPTAEPVSCDLELTNVIFADPDVKDIEVVLEHGYYEFSPPRPSVYLSVEPSTVGASDVGDEVAVDVMINDVEQEIKLVGVQWKLHFNTTLLSVLDVTEGSFFQDWADTVGLDPDAIYFWWLQEKDHVVSFTIYANFSLAPPEVFPEGSGTLATITFNATYKPETGKATCDLILDEEFVMPIDVEGNTIPYHHLENGEFLIPVKLGDLNIDDKVDIRDMAIFGKAYGSYPGHPRWNPTGDLDNDRRVTVIDMVLVAMNFGKEL